MYIWSVIALQCCVGFCYNAVSQLHTYIQPLSLGSPSQHQPPIPPLEAVRVLSCASCTFVKCLLLQTKIQNPLCIFIIHKVDMQ